MQESANFQHGGPEKLTGAHNPRHALQKNGGLADLCYLDDGDILCHPILVPSFLREFDFANARVGAERNPLKTEVTNCVKRPWMGESATFGAWPKRQQSPTAAPPSE